MQPAGIGASRPAALVRWRRRQALGLAIAAGGAAVIVAWFLQGLHADARVAWALLGGSVAAFATAAGTLPVLACATPSVGWRAAMLAFGGGIMLAASFFSLIVPALAAAATLGASAGRAAMQVAVGVAVGACVLALLDRMLDRASPAASASARPLALRRAWLFVAAITLHNFPEGLAIGVAFAGPDTLGAAALAVGISIQDVPEGLVVALALRSVGYERSRAVALGALSGLCEPAAAVFGVAVVALSATLLPSGLAFAAGAMLYVIAVHMAPEASRQGEYPLVATASATGFALMALLDLALG